MVSQTWFSENHARVLMQPGYVHDIKPALSLIAGFILFTVLGTLSHEAAHYLTAACLGYEASLSYGFTYYDGSISASDSFIITLAGPLQTIITGTIGLLLVAATRKKPWQARLTFAQWLKIFLALFWLREIFNLALLFIRYFRTGDLSYETDEIQLAQRLGLPMLSFLLPAAIIGILVVGYLLLKHIPASQRLVFLICGLAGGPMGFYLWFHLVGPAVMP